MKGTRRARAERERRSSERVFMEGLHGGCLRGSSRVMSEGLHRRSSWMFANVREGLHVLECSGTFLWKARAELWMWMWTARAELWKACADACCRPASCPRLSQFNQLPSSHGQDEHQQLQQHRGSRWRSPLLTKCWWCGVVWCCCRVVVVLCCCVVVLVLCCSCGRSSSRRHQGWRRLPVRPGSALGNCIVHP